MPTVRLNPAIQFFASPAEFGGWVRDWVHRHGLSYLLGKSFHRSELPTFETLTDVDWDDATAVAEVVRSYHALYPSTGPLTTEVPNFNLLARANPDRLDINLPGLSARGLSPLSLGSVSRVEESLKVYRAVARDLLARTESGVWFRREGRKTARRDAEMRSGPRAACLMQQGIPLCGAGQYRVARLGRGSTGIAPSERRTVGWLAVQRQVPSPTDRRQEPAPTTDRPGPGPTGRRIAGRSGLLQRFGLGLL